MQVDEQGKVKKRDLPKFPEDNSQPDDYYPPRHQLGWIQQVVWFR